MVFSTLVNSDVREVIRRANALFVDFFETFIGPLEGGLGVKSSHTIGRSHSSTDKQEYKQRIEAINFTMAHDDGASHRELDDADVILVGVSRSGKTPTSLYLALQFGVKAANYPLIPEDFERNRLPEALHAHKKKLYGLTIAPERLQKSAASAGRAAVRGPGQLPLRDRAGRDADAARGHPLDQFNREIDRGNRHHDPARAQARAPRLLESGNSYLLMASISVPMTVAAI